MKIGFFGPSNGLSVEQISKAVGIFKRLNINEIYCQSEYKSSKEIESICNCKSISVNFKELTNKNLDFDLMVIAPESKVDNNKHFSWYLYNKCCQNGINTLLVD